MIFNLKILIYFIVSYGVFAKADCPRKKDVLGLLEIHQSFENGHCLILISQIDPNASTKPNMITKPRDHSKRRYTFRSDGFVELYEPEKVQEIQFLDRKTDLNYRLENGTVVVQLPSGQKVSLGTSQTGNPGLVRSFTGFSSAKETSSGVELVPYGSDSLLISPPAIRGYPHQKKGIKFDYVTSDGKKSSVLGTQIFQEGSEFPTLKKEQLTTLLQRQTSPPTIPNLNKSKKMEIAAGSPLTNQIKDSSINDLSKPQKHDIEKTEPSSLKVTSPEKKSPVSCSIDQVQLSELNAEYLKIQGELSLSKLAYFYLKDSDSSTEKLETKIRALLKAKDLKIYQNLLVKKVSLNASLGLLKKELLEKQNHWKTETNSDFLLSDIDFKFFSIAGSIETLHFNKSGKLINYIRMIDSSYRNSANSKEEKLRKLEERFQQLVQRRDETINKLKIIQTQCQSEAQSPCIDCLMNEKNANFADLKNIVINPEVIKSIEWGSFWLHTGRKGK